jgi:hypothetical protein
MDLGKFAKKPQLVEVVIDDPEIITEYGESISFWMRDHLDIMTYFDFYRSQNVADTEQFNRVLSKILLNSQGQNILKEDEILPVDITLAILTRINQVLGKSKTKSSTEEVGKPQ